MCPMCGSFAVRVLEFDSGVGTEYHDVGEGFRCVQCGAVGESMDLDDDAWIDCPEPDEFVDEPSLVVSEGEPIQDQPGQPEWRDQAQWWSRMSVPVVVGYVRERGEDRGDCRVDGD